jgi:hypothetical protein
VFASYVSTLTSTASQLTLFRGGVPDTVVSEDIASKRNILRKGGAERRQPKEKYKGLAVGSSKENDERYLNLDNEIYRE